jgi:hypothetical protein
MAENLYFSHVCKKMNNFFMPNSYECMFYVKHTKVVLYLYLLDEFSNFSIKVHHTEFI